MELFDFSGKVAIVTGAGSGIGQAAAHQLLERGAVVYGLDLDVSGVPAQAVPVEVDVSDEEGVSAAVERGVAAGQRVDVLLNMAGVGSTTSIVDCALEEWERVFAVNARGTFLTMRAVIPRMLEQASGAIVNTASIVAVVGADDRASYSASKGAVLALTRQVASQYAGAGVRCNCLLPGTVGSPWVERLLAQADDPAVSRATLVARQPIGRLGTPEEVATAALYLASDEASFVTGAAFNIDGGWSAR